VSFALGVGKDEESRPLVASSGVGCSYNPPFRRPPQVGKVSEDNVKAQSEVASDVFQDRESRCHFAKGTQNMGPQVSLIVGALSLSGVTERLAGIAAGQNVDGLQGGEVHGGDVAEVQNVGEVVGEDAAGGFVVFDMPGDLAAQHRLDA
jgi:hypothetical protein